MATVIGVCLTVLLIAVPDQRPNQPDFSGEWVLMTAPSAGPDVAVALTVRQPIVRSTARGAPMQPFFSHLILERHFTTGVRSESLRIGGEGGTVSGGPAAKGQRVETRESVNWSGDTLVIVTSHWSGPPGELRADSQHMEVWQFDAEGRLVITLTDRQGAAEGRTTTLTYRRR